MRSGGSKRSVARRSAGRRQQRPDCTFVFFEQRHCRQGIRRAKKSADELPQLARIGGLNSQSKVSAFLASSESPGPLAEAQPPAMASASLHLAPAEAWTQEQQLPEPPEREDWDLQRRIFNSWRLESTELLAKLDRLLPAVRSPPSLPKFMEAKLCEHWQQLTADCKQEWRPWQTVACLEEQRKKAAEEVEREARRAAQRAENETLLQRDAARSRAGTVRTKPDASPDGRQRQQHGRQHSAAAGSDASNSKRSPKSATATAAGAGRSAGPQEAAIAEASEPPGDTPMPPGHSDTISFSLVSKESLRRGWLQNCNERLLEDKLQSALVKLKYSTGSYRSRSADAEQTKRKQAARQQQQQQQQQQEVQVELQFYATPQPFRTQRAQQVWGSITDPWRQLAPLLQLPSLLPRPTPLPDAEPRRRFAAAFADWYRSIVEGHDASSVAAAAQKLGQPDLLADAELQLLRQHFRASWQSLQETLALSLSQPDENSAASALRSAGVCEPALLRLLAGRLPQACASYCRLLLCRAHDASQLVLYPSGRPALLQCGWSGATVAMSDGDRHSRRVLAVVDASACGFVHSESPESPAFLATRSAAILQDAVGRLLKRWRWPADTRAKLPGNLQVKLNSNLTFVCSARGEMTFSFSASGRSAQLQAGFRADRQAAVRDRCRDKNGDVIITLSESLKVDGERESIPWKSEAARRLLARAKLVRKQQQQARRGHERPAAEASADGSSSLRSARDDWAADDELEAARQRIRSTCDAWLQHCRSILGLQRAASRGSRTAASASSAQASARDLRSRSSLAGDSRRLPSAPAAGDRQLSASASVAEGVAEGVEEGVADELCRTAAAACPAALRRQLLGQGDCRCRCNYWLQPPALGDIELDAFVQAQAQRSPEQLLVVAVADSSAVGCSGQLARVCRHYADINRQRRTSPCTAAAADPFRLLLYDLSSAACGCRRTIPLLLLRHNLRSGDCLIYRAARILFAGRLPPPEQLRRQLAECRRLAARGCQGLPADFRLQRQLHELTQAAPAAARVATLEAVSLLSASERPNGQVALPRIH